MRIGVISSSVDNIILFRFLQKYNFVYILFLDQEGGDRSEKNNEYVIPRVEKLLEISKSRGIDAVILPPSVELYFSQQLAYKDYVFPLFRKYLLQECLPFSRIGKVGFLGDYFDEKQQDLVKQVCGEYELNEIQQNTKNFHKLFVYRFKQVRMRKFFLMQLGWKNWMMHNIVKHDLRSLLDAGVDTIIPCNYGYMAYDVTIQKYIRMKKIYRHGLKKIEKVFDELLQGKDKKQQEYAINIVYTGHIDHLLAEKKLVWLLQKGNQYPIQSEKIYL